jgi:hypothetical protein
MLLGNIVKQAEQVGVLVPTVRAVYHMLLEINQHIRNTALPLYTAEEQMFNHESGRSQTLVVSN